MNRPPAQTFRIEYDYIFPGREPEAVAAAIGGVCVAAAQSIAPWRAIGGVWRATPDEDEHYIYAIVL